MNSISIKRTGGKVVGWTEETKPTIWDKYVYPIPSSHPPIKTGVPGEVLPPPRFSCQNDQHPMLCYPSGVKYKPLLQPIWTAWSQNLNPNPNLKCLAAFWWLSAPWPGRASCHPLLQHPNPGISPPSPLSCWIWVQPFSWQEYPWWMVGYLKQNSAFKPSLRCFSDEYLWITSNSALYCQVSTWVVSFGTTAF